MKRAIDRKLRLNKKKPKKSFLKFLIFLVPVVFIFFTVFFLIFRGGDLWNGKSRLSLAIPQKDGSVLVTVLDPVSANIINVHIPENVEVEAAHSLGTWKLGSIGKLGENEGLGGALLSLTITKAFKFPTEAWAEAPSEGLTEASPVKIFSGVFSFYKTNLSLIDRIKIALFTLRVSGSGRQIIELTDTSYLHKQILTGGESGYVIRGTMPTSLLSVFADSQVSKENARVVILDKSGSGINTGQFGEIIEVLGSKVISILKKPVDPGQDCTVSAGDNSKIATIRKISQVFGCKISNILPEGERDTGDVIVIVVGVKFATRF